MHPCRPHFHWLAAPLLTLGLAAPSAADVKGHAYAVYAKLPSYGLSSVTHCDCGWLDRKHGGSQSSHLSNVSYGNTLRVDYMQSDSHGDRCKGHSGSTLEAGYLMKGSAFEVTWTHMESIDEDVCCQPEDIDDLPSVFVGLTFAGKPVVVTGKPNQVLTVPGKATLILNEVRHDEDEEGDEDGDHDCDHDNSEHHALHLILANGNEVILASAKFDSDDDCCALTPTHASTWGAVKAHYR